MYHFYGLQSGPSDILVNTYRRFWRSALLRSNTALFPSAFPTEDAGPMQVVAFPACLYFIYMFLSLFIFEIGRERVGEGQRERLPSIDNAEPSAGPELTNHEIMT